MQQQIPPAMQSMMGQQPPGGMPPGGLQQGGLPPPGMQQGGMQQGGMPPPGMPPAMQGMMRQPTGLQEFGGSLMHGVGEEINRGGMNASMLGADAGGMQEYGGEMMDKYAEADSFAGKVGKAIPHLAPYAALGAIGKGGVLPKLLGMGKQAGEHSALSMNPLIAALMNPSGPENWKALAETFGLLGSKTPPMKTAARKNPRYE
jgi:hypothetical protein